MYKWGWGEYNNRAFYRYYLIFIDVLHKSDSVE